MVYKEFQENWKNFSDLIEKFSTEHPQQNEQLKAIIKRYIEQNLQMLNDVFSTSIEALEHLKEAKSVNDVICAQAKLTHKLNEKLALSAQRFLNASLGNIADYNEWLKSHCDLATD